MFAALATRARAWLDGQQPFLVYHLVVEGAFAVLLAVLLLQNAYAPGQRGKRRSAGAAGGERGRSSGAGGAAAARAAPGDELTETEIDALCTEWEPKPLVPPPFDGARLGQKRGTASEATGQLIQAAVTVALGVPTLADVYSQQLRDDYTLLGYAGDGTATVRLESEATSTILARAGSDTGNAGGDGTHARGRLHDKDHDERRGERQRRVRTFSSPPPLSSSATAVGTRHCLNLASANYAGVLTDKRIQDACEQTLARVGLGACGPRGFYGTVDVHLLCEYEIAKFMRTPEAILYSFGAATATSVINAFAKRGDVIFCDEYVNFPIQTGALLSRSTVVWYRHNDIDDLERKIFAVEPTTRKKRKSLRQFIVTEGVFAKDGRIAPLHRIAALKRRHANMRVMVDESHAFGVLGATGRGATEHFGLTLGEDVDIITCDMGCALGTVGGFCVGGESAVVDHQRLSGAGYCFSAAQPPYLAEAATVALRILRDEPQRTLKVQRNARFMRECLREALPEMVCVGFESGVDDNAQQQRRQRQQRLRGEHERADGDREDGDNGADNEDQDGAVDDDISPMIHLRLRDDYARVLVTRVMQLVQASGRRLGTRAAQLAVAAATAALPSGATPPQRVAYFDHHGGHRRSRQDDDDDDVSNDDGSDDDDDDDDDESHCDCHQHHDHHPRCHRHRHHRRSHHRHDDRTMSPSPASSSPPSPSSPPLLGASPLLTQTTMRRIKTATVSAAAATAKDVAESAANTDNYDGAAVTEMVLDRLWLIVRDQLVRHDEPGGNGNDHNIWASVPETLAAEHARCAPCLRLRVSAAHEPEVLRRAANRIGMVTRTMLARATSPSSSSVATAAAAAAAGGAGTGDYGGGTRHNESISHRRGGVGDSGGARLGRHRRAMSQA